MHDLPGADDAAAIWDRDHDLSVLRFLFQQIEDEFESQTLAICRRLTLDDAAVSDIAREYGVSVGSVYVARSRVLRRLRQAAEEMLGETLEDAVSLADPAATEAEH